MPAITRLGIDKSAGHCFTPRATTSAGQSSVFMNNALVNVIGAYYPVHTCKRQSHDGVATGGSSTVFIEGKPVHRIGDSISCGDVAAAGSSDGFCG